MYEKSNPYFDWLLERIHQPRHSDYDELLLSLYQTDFYYSIDFDKNRAIDGRDLRRDFERDTQVEIYDAIENEPVANVLEVLIALAIRIDDEYIGDPGEAHPEYIFWEMIRNLNLDFMTNDRFNPRFYTTVIHNWMHRKFLKSGYGSIFPLKHFHRDQREIQIWCQMMDYINENYHF